MSGWEQRLSGVLESAVGLMAGRQLPRHFIFNGLALEIPFRALF